MWSCLAWPQLGVILLPPLPEGLGYRCSLPSPHMKLLLPRPLRKRTWQPEVDRELKKDQDGITGNQSGGGVSACFSPSPLLRVKLIAPTSSSYLLKPSHGFGSDGNRWKSRPKRNLLLAM